MAIPIDGVTANMSRLMGADGPFNYKTWYQANKDKLAEKRKQRYESDQSYRDKVLNQNKSYRTRLSEGLIPRGQPDHKPRKTQIIEIEGKQFPAFYISLLSKQVGRTIPTLYGWERKGILPITPFWIGEGIKRERLYTMDMINIVTSSAKKRNLRLSTKDKSFYEEVSSQWKSIGISALPQRTIFDQLERELDATEE